MIAAFILGTNARTVDYFHRSCLGIKDIAIPLVLDSPAPLHQLLRMLNTHTPRVVFLEIDPLGGTYQTAVDIVVASPGTTVIGFGAEAHEGILEEGAEFGVKNFLAAPFEATELHVAIQRAIKEEGGDTHPIVALQSAMGGCGATTIALNVANALASDFKRKVLLVDTDLRSGPLPYWFDIEPEPSIVEVLEACNSLNDQTWRSLLHRFRGFDVILSPKNRRKSNFQYSSWDFLRMLGYAALKYDAVIVDLPEAVEEEFEVARERADFKFVVCTGDRVSASMARRRIDEMEGGGADIHNVAVILNKLESGSLPKAQVEKIVRRPVALELPRDAPPGEASFMNTLLRKRSKLIQGYRRLAEAIDKQAPSVQPSGVARVAEAVASRVARATAS